MENEMQTKRSKTVYTPEQRRIISDTAHNPVYKNVSTMELTRLFNDKHPDIFVGYNTMLRIRNGEPIRKDHVSSTLVSDSKIVVSLADVVEINNRFINTTIPTLLEDIEDKLAQLLDTIELYSQTVCFSDFDPVGRIKKSRIPRFLGELRQIIDAGKDNGDATGSVLDGSPTETEETETETEIRFR